MVVKNAVWFIFAFFAISIGLYPLGYYFFNMSKGLLSTKSVQLLNDGLWKINFYTHISMGGLALLTGWVQFSKKFRRINIARHRIIGKIYVVAVLLSGSAGIYVACFSTGGLVTHFGFGLLAISWLFTTISAFITIRKGNVIDHKKWMIRSYALCFAAVTLRLWIPLFQILLHYEFVPAYKIISWLCWIPNLIFAEFLIRKKQNSVMNMAPVQLEKTLL